jgi:hypothetical protein
MPYHSSRLRLLPFAIEDAEDRLQTLSVADTLQSIWGRANPTENRGVWAKGPEAALLHAILPQLQPLP